MLEEQLMEKVVKMTVVTKVLVLEEVDFVMVVSAMALVGVPKDHMMDTPRSAYGTILYLCLVQFIKLINYQFMNGVRTKNL
ncbi:hypothetical protein HanIR_Chr06g0261041 [Helianthus annuus]|nr:hypothetical protein HanIR_Chr06g0261041 [Helianthus annuus]